MTEGDAKGATVAGSEALVPLLVLCLLGACALWVLRDAQARAGKGHPVGLYLGNLQLDKPEVWAVACLVMWFVFFPLYLKARSES